MGNPMLRIRGVHARHVDEVGNHRRGSGLCARALAVIQGRADRITLDQYRVHSTFDVGDQPLGRNQCRMHAQLDAFRRVLGDPKQLDPVTKLFSVLDINRFELGDPFDVGLVEAHWITKGYGTHQRQLVGRIDALDVEGRIGFCIAQPLRLLENGIKRQTLAPHFGKNEVRRAVDDPGNPFDVIRGQSLTQRLDDRDAPSHRRLERHHDAIFLRGSKNLVTVLGQQGLVGRDHMLAVFDCLEHQFAGNAIATDQFDDHIYFRIGDHRKRIISQTARSASHFPCQFQIPVGHHRNLDRSACAARNFFRVAFENGIGSATDGTDAQQTHIHCFHFNAFLKQYEETCIPSRK